MINILRPNMIGIGGQKCASTWLSECLRYHPQIFMSDVKEIHYFTKYYNKGEEWYLQHFEKATRHKIVGEFSTLYLYEIDAPARIKKLLGNIKIVAVIRNPIERFISHYKQAIRKGLLNKKNYAKLDEDSYKKAIILIPGLLNYGIYSDGLCRYVEMFGKENVKVLIKEDIDNDPAKELEKLYEYLGVDNEYKPNIVTKMISPGIVPRFMLPELIRQKLYWYFKNNNPKMIAFIKRHRIIELYRYINSNNKEIHVDKDVYESLSKYYQEDIGKLEKLLCRDLDSWRAIN